MSRCPICKKPSAKDFRPFCSKRCADVDLGRWMKGSYVVPGEDGSAAEEIAKRTDVGNGEDDEP